MSSSNFDLFLKVGKKLLRKGGFWLLGFPDQLLTIPDVFFTADDERGSLVEGFGLDVEDPFAAV